MATSDEESPGRQQKEARRFQGRAKRDEKWLRLAEEGDTDAMCMIAQSLHRDGDLDAAERWYRRASMTADIPAMRALAFLLKERGKLDEAESWFRGIARHDDADGMYDLGRLLEERGKNAEAQAWFRLAAAKDNVRAMVSLAVETQNSGRPTDAEIWWHTAADNGDPIALVYRALQAYDQGDIDEANIRWWRAVAAGALWRLAEDLYVFGDEWTSPEHWWSLLTWGFDSVAERFVSALGWAQDPDGVGRRRILAADTKVEESARAALRRSQFEQFYVLMAPELRGFARSLTSDEGAAADAVHDAMIRLLDRWDRLHTLPLPNLRAYAFNSVRWAFQDRARARYREGTTSLDSMPFVERDSAVASPATTDSGAEDLIAEETTRQILRVLSPRERELTTRLIAGRTPGEIADELNMNPDTVRRLISRARKKIRSELGLNLPQPG
ncbi:sigma-70 family RNA polymerase sigma factor [Nocardia sp. BMG51109]|uniref:sigma-70 family RNA polymerase sigma factor n=1 Tax=Nocardia sp. BMG51109 TaxID=1056816 RepID=UPI001E4DEB2E|nr:sigma-70 family RNA polymerase sigma factor [Nocardia sp. BMG51109]